MPVGGLVAAVQEGSIAAQAGITPGCCIHAVNAHPLHDIIDWRWYAAEDEIELEFFDPEGVSHTVFITRDAHQDWGVDFKEALFDETKQCRNACTFCFMQQLPSDSRDSLRLRDDDFRLSFLQGTFVTLTNISPEEEGRIITQHISPLRYSLHAIDPDVRRSMIGKHAAYGLSVFQRLLDAGIQFHVQIVLMPNINDQEELSKTLSWAYEQAGILSVGIVPVGYTKHQSALSASFTTPVAAREVIDLIKPFQRRAMRKQNDAWVHVSDEFYRNAYPDNLLEMVPPAEFYGNFDLFEDGIGIIRSSIDDFLGCAPQQALTAQALKDAGLHAVFVSGCAQKEFFTPLLEKSPCKNLVEPLYVVNDYFGGNVDVTGLLCACDIVKALKAYNACASGDFFAVIPSVVFNADGLTLDGATVDEIARDAACEIHVVSCEASKNFSEIAAIAANRKAGNCG